MVLRIASVYYIIDGKKAFYKKCAVEHYFSN